MRFDFSSVVVRISNVKKIGPGLYRRRWTELRIRDLEYIFYQL